MTVYYLCKIDESYFCCCLWTILFENCVNNVENQRCTLIDRLLGESTTVHRDSLEITFSFFEIVGSNCVMVGLGLIFLVLLDFNTIFWCEPIAQGVKCNQSV